MKYHNLNFEAAKQKVQKARPFIYPNPGFVGQLVKWDLELNRRKQYN
jgi:hypothetical protein